MPGRPGRDRGAWADAAGMTNEDLFPAIILFSDWHNERPGDRQARHLHAWRGRLLRAIVVTVHTFADWSDYRNWTTERLIDFEQSLYDAEVAGDGDAWFRREEVLTELRDRRDG